MKSPVDYRFAREGSDVMDYFRPGVTGLLYRYLVTASGVFIQAKRPGLTASIRAGAPCAVRGLADPEPAAFLTLPRVPARLVADCFNRARSACVVAGTPREILFYLIHEEAGGWRVVEPEQVATGAGVRPADPSNEDCGRALIELHSHHEMAAFWSGTDDADETGFKLYAVIGRIFSRPSLRVRVGVYGHFHELAASDVFEMPEGIAGRGAGEDAAEDDGEGDDPDPEEEEGAPRDFVYRVGPFYLG